MLNENSILITAIRDPFNHYSSRLVQTKEYEVKTVEEYAREVLPEPCEDFEVLISVVGKGVVPNDYIPLPRSNIVFTQVPTGGGDNQVIRMVAMLAIVIIAAYAGPAAGALAGAQGSFGYVATNVLVQSAIVVGGSLLVNALLPIESPGESEVSASYSWSGVNVVTEGSAFPVIYGKVRVLPVFIGMFLRNAQLNGINLSIPGFTDSRDTNIFQFTGNVSEQQLHLLCAVADHPVQIMDEIKLNGTEYSGYPNVVVNSQIGAIEEQGYDETGPELIINAVDRNFTGGGSNWANGNFSSWNDTDDLSVVATEGSIASIAGEHINLTKGKSYCLAFDADNVVGTFSFYVAGVTFLNWFQKLGVVTVDSHHRFYFTAEQEVGVLYFSTQGAGSADFDNFSIKEVVGGTPATTFPGFMDVHTQQNKNIKIDSDEWIIIEVPGTQTTVIGIGISHPRGLGYWNDNGDVEAERIDLEVQYRPKDNTPPLEYPPSIEGGWIPWIRGKSKGNSGQPIRWQARSDKPVTYTNYYGANLPPGQYEIRVRSPNTVFSTSSRYIQDTYVEFVEGITTDYYRYPGSAILAIEAMATDQLSGGFPTVSAVVTRGDITVIDDNGVEHSQNSTNPAWACLDLLQNHEYGCDIPYTRTNWSEFSQWALFCDANGYTCNIVFDITMTVPAALARLSVLGRGHVIQRGTNFGVLIDQVSDPVQMFGMGNIVEGSLKTGYLSRQNRANVLNVTYYDANYEYEEKSFQLRTSDFDTDTSAEENKSDIVIYGCTDYSMALKLGKFLINCNEYLKKTVQFDAQVDSMASNVGDVILVSHDVPEWGYSGRVVSATGTTIILDQSIFCSEGVNYRVMVRHSVNDILEEVDLINPADVGGEGEYNTFTLNTYWNLEPIKDDTYAFGEEDYLYKEFRITRITRADDMHRTITALEYRSEVYNDAVSIPDYPDDSNFEPFVSDIILTEVWRKEDGIIRSIIHAAWRGRGINYVFYKEESESNWTPAIGSPFTNKNWAEIRGLETGKTYYVCVSLSLSVGDGISATITIGGYSEPGPNITQIKKIWPVSGLQIYGQGNNTIWQNRDLKLTWHLTTDSFPVEADDEILGASTYPPITEFGGYRIRILNSNGSLRRELNQFESEYTYTYEKNSEDGNGSPSPNLIIKVWARSTYGQESEFPAIITVSNPAPSAPSGLSALVFMKAVKFQWKKNTEIDFGYYRFRTKVGEDNWSSWGDPFEGTETIRGLTSTEEDTWTSNVRIYIELKAFDTFGTESSVVATNATTAGLNVQSTDIGDFIITASKLFVNFPFLEGDSWEDNIPAPGNILWNDHVLVLGGQSYNISAGTSDNQYIYWINGSSGYASSNEHPADAGILGDGDYIIATNKEGAHDLAYNAMANLAVGSLYVMHGAISDAHIVDLTADKITSGKLQGIEVIGNIIKTSDNVDQKQIIITSDGITLWVPAATGKYGTIKYSQGQYGANALAFIHHTNYDIPFKIVAEPGVGGGTLADFGFFNRTSTPTGPAERGEVCVVNGKLYICEADGDPGTWTIVGTQIA